MPKTFLGTLLVLLVEPNALPPPNALGVEPKALDPLGVDPNALGALPPVLPKALPPAPPPNALPLPPNAPVAGFPNADGCPNALGAPNAPVAGAGVELPNTPPDEPPKAEVEDETPPPPPPPKAEGEATAPKADVVDGVGWVDEEMLCS